MYKKKVNIYVRETTSKFELLKNKKMIKILRTKNKTRKCIYRLILRFIIILNFYIKYLLCIPMQKNVKTKDTEIIIPILNGKIYRKRVEKNIKQFYEQDKYNLIFSEKILKLYTLDSKIQNTNILTGKGLTRAMLDIVLRYIVKQRDEKIETKRIYILVNNLQESMELIRYFSEIVKSVNIVTNQIKSFQIFADKLYNSEGVMITVSNNMRKSLRCAEIIVNMDFSEQDILMYNLNRKAIIINLSTNIIRLDKIFEGIIVNSLSIKNSIRHGIYEKNSYYESCIINYDNYKEMADKIKMDKVDIEYLIGNRGKIENFEYTKIA